MSGKDGHMKPTTYRGHRFGYGGNQQPNETLVNG